MMHILFNQRYIYVGTAQNFKAKSKKKYGAFLFTYYVFEKITLIGILVTLENSISRTNQFFLISLKDKNFSFYDAALVLYN